MATISASDGRIVLGSDFPTNFARVLPRLLAPAALPGDWDPHATTYDLTRFDSDEAFAARFEKAVNDLIAGDVNEPSAIAKRLAEVGLPFDYARLGQPLSTVFELHVQALTGAARCFSFASVTKPWLSIIESPRRTQRVRIYAEGVLPVSEEKKTALREAGCEIHEGFSGVLPALTQDALTVWVANAPITGKVDAVSADAICFPVTHGGVLLLRDPTRIDPVGIQLIRKRTVSALIAFDAQNELERAASLTPTRFAEASESTCTDALRGFFPQVSEALFFCTGLAAEAATFAAVGDVLGPTPVTFFYAQNGYGGTGQLIADLLGRKSIRATPLAVLGEDERRRSVTLVDRIIASLAALGSAPACVFLETPTNPELQAHDFDGLMNALRLHRERTGNAIPVIVDTTLAPLFPVFAQGFAKDWPFLLVKSGSKYFTKGKTTLGVVGCANEPLALRIVTRARELGRDADSFAKPAQLGALSEGLGDLVPRMKKISEHTIRLAAGLRAALARRGHDVTLYAIDEKLVGEGLASGLLSFYLPPAPTTFPDLVDEFVAYLLAKAPLLVKSRVSYGQSTGGGKADFFYVINPEESTQGALSAAVKAAQKRNDVQICRISVPANADVDALLAAMEGFFDAKYPQR